MSAFSIRSRIRMKSGYDIPVLGYGVFSLSPVLLFLLILLSQVYQTSHAVCEEVVGYALKAGYRHVSILLA
jgi:diketogulonate reductase-like aldo/keto reductase